MRSRKEIERNADALDPQYTPELANFNLQLLILETQLDIRDLLQDHIRRDEAAREAVPPPPKVTW